ncbi:MAG: hypothetical protein AAGB97_05075 [Dehalococcoidia bacterium]|nr:hypothetical protein [Chloroflexota bacterium]MBT9160832.1 hypothetical protein [Chloroflexota bacterium]
MGMFDTIHFDREYTCPMCGESIVSIQVKQFDKILENYYVKDCISHAEEVRIIKDELFCSKNHSGISIYIVVNRGILMGTTQTMEEARRLLDDLNLEKLILWYHDLYRRYVEERREQESYRRFLEDLREWYGERLYEKSKDELTMRLWLGWNSRHLRGALSAVESIERFLSYKKMLKALDKLWEEGNETLDIYYPEEMLPGEEDWSVDVYQDELNDLCHLNWTWTVMSKKGLEAEGEKEDELPEWSMVAEEPFSDEVVCQSIKRWLQGRGYKFEVRLIPLEQARGSGLIKRLMQIDIESEKKGAVPLEQAMEELIEEEEKRMAGMIERQKGKSKVFYYDGFYGSLVPDVESDRLIGKIEGVKKNIIYEGKTIKECEQKFKEAVLKYQKEV